MTLPNRYIPELTPYNGSVLRWLHRPEPRGLTRKGATMSTTPTAPTTRPAMLGIAHNGPVRVTELGTGHGGIVWTVQPENFPALLAMVNANGGPDCWRIEAL